VAEPTELFRGMSTGARLVREEMAAAFGDKGVRLPKLGAVCLELGRVAACDLPRTTLRFGLG
jgi:hypothetical protein